MQALYEDATTGQCERVSISRRAAGDGHVVGRSGPIQLRAVARDNIRGWGELDGPCIVAQPEQSRDRLLIPADTATSLGITL